MEIQELDGLHFIVDSEAGVFVEIHEMSAAILLTLRSQLEALQSWYAKDPEGCKAFVAGENAVCEMLATIHNLIEVEHEVKDLFANIEPEDFVGE